MDTGIFILIGNNGWPISETAPQYMPPFALNKEIVQKAEGDLRLRLRAPDDQIARLRGEAPGLGVQSRELHPDGGLAP